MAQRDGSENELKMRCQKHRFESKIPLPCPHPEHEGPSRYVIPVMPTNVCYINMNRDGTVEPPERRTFERRMVAMVTEGAEQRLSGWLWYETTPKGDG